MTETKVSLHATDKRTHSSVSGDSIAVIIFVFALCLRVWFNFFAHHINCFSVADAAEYLRNAQALYNLKCLPSSVWSHCGLVLSGVASPEIIEKVSTAFLPLKDFSISGPIFPMFLLSSFLLSNTTFDMNNWMVPLAVQSFLSATSCVLIYFIGAHCFNRSTAGIAGLVAAIYPGFIVGSGRLYPESFAVFLLCLIVWLSVRGMSPGGNNYFVVFLLGITSACLQLTRSIMFVLSLVLFPLTFFQSRTRRPFIALMCLSLGFAAVIIPWLAFQKLAFGKVSLIVDRVGHYNFFIGNNADTQGWLSFPYPDGRGIEAKGYSSLALESLEKSPSRYLKLMLLDKLPRLFKFPWNDFKTTVGILDIRAQAIIHQLILVLAAIGTVLSLALNGGGLPATHKQKYCRAFITGVLLYHLIYLAFITVPRYAVTAMPFVILLASAGVTSLAWLLQLPRTRYLAQGILLAATVFFSVLYLDITSEILSLPFCNNVHFALVCSCLIKAIPLVALTFALWQAVAFLPGNHFIARLLAVGLALMVLPSACLPARAHGRWWEWQYHLNHVGETISQTIHLPPSVQNDLTSRQVYLLIDSEGAKSLTNHVEIKVNGVTLSGPFIPSLSLVEDLSHYEQQDNNRLALPCEYIFDCLTIASGIDNTDLRQWFLVPIPKEALCSKDNKGHVTVDIRKTDSIDTRFFGTYDISRKYVNLPSLTRYSWEKSFYGVENLTGLSDPRYDLKLTSNATTTSLSKKINQAFPADVPSGHFLIRLLSSPTNSNPSHITMLKTFSLRVPASKGAYIATLTDLPNRSPDNVWLIRIAGKVRAQSTHTTAGIELKAIVQGTHGELFTYVSPWAPRVIPTGPSGTSFDVAFPVNPGAFPGNLTQLQLGFYSRSPRLSHYTKETQDACVEFQNTKVEISSLPAMPTACGHNIF